MPAGTDELRAGTALGADGAIGDRPFADYEGERRERLDVVDDRGAAEEPFHRGERRLRSRLAAHALD